MKFSELSKIYLEYREKEFRRREICIATLNRDRNTLSKVCRIVGETEIESMKADDFASLRDELFKISGRHYYGRSIATVHRMLDHGVQLRVIPEPFFGPEFKIPKQKRMSSVDKSLTREEILYLANAGEHGAIWCPKQWKAIVLLSFNCAFEPGSIGILRRKNIDGRWVSLERPKTGTFRKAWLADQTKAALDDYLKTERPAMSEDGNDCVFLNSDGRPWFREHPSGYSGTQLGMYYRRYSKNYEPGIGMYSLRRTFSTVAQGLCDTGALRVVMGHTAERTMEDVYRQNVPDKRIKELCQFAMNWLFESQD